MIYRKLLRHPSQQRPVAPTLQWADGWRAKNKRVAVSLDVWLCSTDETPSQYIEIVALIEQDQDCIARFQKLLPISENRVLLVGSVAHGAGVYDARGWQEGKHFDIEAIFDVYAFAEGQRVAEDQNSASGARILRDQPLAVLVSSNAPFFAGRIDQRRQEIRRIAPSCLRIGAEEPCGFSGVAGIDSQSRFSSEGCHHQNAEQKSCPMQGHSHFRCPTRHLFRSCGPTKPCRL